MQSVSEKIDDKVITQKHHQKKQTSLRFNLFEEKSLKHKTHNYIRGLAKDFYLLHFNLLHVVEKNRDDVPSSELLVISVTLTLPLATTWKKNVPN